MKGLEERMRWVRGTVKVSAFAESIGVSRSSIENWEAGKHEPPADALYRICDTYGINEAWLLSGRGKMKRQSDAQALDERARGIHESLSNFRASAEEQPSPGYFLVPVYSVAASSGHGAVPLAAELLDPMMFPRRLLRRLSSSPDSKLCIVFNRGESNEPEIMDGDAMLVDRGIERIVGDAFYIFDLGGVLLVKMIERLAAGGIALKSKNPAYEREIIPQAEAEAIAVFGRVVWRGGLV